MNAIGIPVHQFQTGSFKGAQSSTIPKPTCWSHWALEVYLSLTRMNDIWIHCCFRNKLINRIAQMHTEGLQWLITTIALPRTMNQNLQKQHRTSPGLQKCLSFSIASALHCQRWSNLCKFPSRIGLRFMGCHHCSVYGLALSDWPKWMSTSLLLGRLADTF